MTKQYDGWAVKVPDGEIMFQTIRKDEKSVELNFPHHANNPFYKIVKVKIQEVE